MRYAYIEELEAEQFSHHCCREERNEQEVTFQGEYVEKTKR